jgi:hypothetical protein
MLWVGCDNPLIAKTDACSEPRQEKACFLSRLNPHHINHIKSYTVDIQGLTP